MAIGKTNAQDKSTNYWQVQKIEGASFHFKKNDSGYWVNTNAATGSNNANTAAVCKVFFRMAQTDKITFTINQDSELNFDYGIIGALDTELTLTSTADSTILKSFQGVSGTETFTANIPKGEHFVYIKYRKDSSASDGTDTFQFTITSGATEIESGADVREVTATAADVLQSKFFVDSSGELKQGSMLSYTPSSTTELLNPDSSSFTLPGNTHIASTFTISAPSLTASTPVTPTTTEQTINYEYYGLQQPYFLNSVKVAGDTNLKSEYIKSGVSIFGVDGDYAGTTIISISGSMTINQSSSNAFFVDCSATFTNSEITSNMKNFIIIPTIPLTYVNQTTILVYSQNLNDKKMYINTTYSPYSGDFTATFSNGKMTFLHSTQNTLIPPTGTWVGFCW